MDKTELLNLITDEDIVNILTNEFDSIKGQETSQYIIFSAVCHNSSSMKLYYYKESKTFHCYSQCSCNYSVFDLIGQVLGLPFLESYKWLCNYKGVKNTRQQFRGFKSRDSENKDLEFLKLHSYKPAQNEIVLPEYSDKVLRNFDKAIEESWYEEGINDEEVLDKFEILYNYYDGSMIIPYFSEDGTHLNGIMRRSFNKEDVDNGRKYMPLEWNRITYKFNKRLVLYGYYQNKENIDKLHKCILYEAEKSVLKLSCYKGLENGIGLGLGGMNLSKQQLQLLLKRDIDEVCIALDKQVRTDLIDLKEDTEEVVKAKKEYNIYIDKVKKIYVLLCNYFTVTVILDWTKGGDSLLDYKSSPIDHGEQIWDYLYENRCVIDSKESLEELYIFKENGERY